MASGIIFVGKTPERTETNVANIFAGTVVTDQSISQKKQEEKLINRCQRGFSEKCQEVKLRDLKTAKSLRKEFSFKFPLFPDRIGVSLSHCVPQI